MSDRSQRRHELTRAEIKAVARAHLVRSGPAGISLRAIARDMGITAPALYRYYPALDSLILELCTDLHVELRWCARRNAISNRKATPSRA
jgi:AcrR family transcriptional regulator